MDIILHLPVWKNLFLIFFFLIQYHYEYRVLVERQFMIIKNRTQNFLNFN